MIVAIHQPEAFPWLGFFHKMYLADVFVILDTVQFEKNNVQNRNKFLIGGEARYLTIPIKKSSLDTKIKDIEIDWENPITKKHLVTFEQNYKKHPNFEEVFLLFKNLYVKKPVLLTDFNLEVILFLKEKFGIETKVVKASELDLSGEAKGGTEVTLEICKQLKAKKYLSGAGAKVYLKKEEYDTAGIEVFFQEFSHPEYSQKKQKEFIPYLSALDLYLNHGKDSLNILLKNNIDKL